MVVAIVGIALPSIHYCLKALPKITESIDHNVILSADGMPWPRVGALQGVASNGIYKKVKRTQLGYSVPFVWWRTLEESDDPPTILHLGHST